MESMPPFMREIFGNTGAFGNSDIPDVGADIDAFNDAYEEVYTEFLSKRNERGSYLELGTKQMVERMQMYGKEVLDSYDAEHAARRATLIELVMCGLEILSLPRGK